MNKFEKRTYLVYSRGLMPEDLTLGSLYLDPANPVGNERKCFPVKLPPDRLSEWTGTAQVDQPCSLSTTAGHEWLAGAGVLGALKGQIARRGSIAVRVSGQTGRRLQIKRPECFLNEILLSSSAARMWLATQLSISRRMSLAAWAWSRAFQQPRIWMVTGVQYISGAHITDTASKVLSVSVDLTLPFPEPVAATALVLGSGGPNSLGITTSRQRSGHSRMEYGHTDERVWAAQFAALSVKYYWSGETASPRALSERIALRDLVDLGPTAVRSVDERRDIEQFAEVLGLEEESRGGSISVLDTMLDVDWGLLDEYLSMAYNEHACATSALEW